MPFKFFARIIGITVYGFRVFFRFLSSWSFVKSRRLWIHTMKVPCETWQRSRWTSLAAGSYNYTTLWLQNHYYHILGEVPSRTLSFLAESSIIKLCTWLKTIAMHKIRKKLMSVKSDRQVSVQFFFNFLTMWGTLKILNNLNSNH